MGKQVQDSQLREQWWRYNSHAVGKGFKEKFENSKDRGEHRKKLKNSRRRLHGSEQHVECQTVH